MDSEPAPNKLRNILIVCIFIYTGLIGTQYQLNPPQPFVIADVRKL